MKTKEIKAARKSTEVEVAEMDVGTLFYSECKRVILMKLDDGKAVILHNSGDEWGGPGTVYPYDLFDDIARELVPANSGVELRA